MGPPARLPIELLKELIVDGFLRVLFYLSRIYLRCVFPGQKYHPGNQKAYERDRTKISECSPPVFSTPSPVTHPVRSWVDVLFTQHRTR